MRDAKKKTVHWDPEVPLHQKSTVTRLPQTSIKNIVPDIISRHHKSFDRTALYLKKYAHDLQNVRREYRQVYPAFGIWRAFRDYGATRGLDYRTGNVEDYMLSALYPGMPLNHARILKPPGFSLKQT
jgi:hypothetical protein